MRISHMQIKRIVYDAHFDRKFKKYFSILGKTDRDEAMNALEVFRNNPFDKKLSTHKLNGALKDYWAFSLDHRHRIIFRLLKNSEVFLVDVGGHDIYR